MGGPAVIDGQAVASTDNFYVAPFVIDGVEWSTAEHYYQAAKYLRGGDASEWHSGASRIEEIRAAESGAKAWSLGQRSSVDMRPDWEHVKVNVMYRAVSAKYEAHPCLAKELAATRGPIEAAFSTMGAHDNWQRLNSLILERVREELRPAEARNQKRYAALVSLTEPRLQGEAAIASLRASFAKQSQG
eukprot:TRINITY_DN7793_c2_g2_i1.p1 TRINITY_DN7793_c2_g2~~TRINITY_DN7793_c2_g2_i1.p1  ORF type:complete len:205 (+),score=37.88 TRINITY_DN7793_c2_g2_i1:54-617(+)